MTLSMRIRPAARTTRRMAATLTALLLPVAWAAAGEIAGTLKPPGRVSSVVAVDRAKENPGEIKSPFTATVDVKTGAYHFRNLPAGTYDIVLETDVGRIEGVDLGVDRTDAKQQPMTLEPSELDKGEITAITTFLKELVEDRSEKEMPTVEWLLGRVRQARMKEVWLGKGALDGRETETMVRVPLKDEELPQVSDLLLGLISLVRVRDQLPRDYDLVIDVREGKPGKILVNPVPPELTEADRKWLIDWVNGLKIFENKKRVLDLDGTGTRARVLVEKLRDTPTTLPVKEPTAFWRTEIFDFQKYYGGWTKEKYTVIVRQRVSIQVFRTYRWMFEKRLGGIRVAADGVTTVPEYAVPQTLDPARGRVPF